MRVNIWKSDYEPDVWADMMVNLGLPLSTFRFSLDPTAITDYQAEFMTKGISLQEEKNER